MKGNNHFFQLFSKALPALLLFFCWSVMQLSAQDATFTYEGKYHDYTIPQTSKKYIVITAVGGGGGVGIKKGSSSSTRIPAGEGAFVQSYFEIGTSGTKLKPGSTLRIMVGGKGTDLEISDPLFGQEATMFGAGGGGGTGIAYKDAVSNDWSLLMVAAGGGGSGHDIVTPYDLKGIAGIGYVPGNEGSGKGGLSGGKNKDKAGGGAGAFGDDDYFAGLKLNGDPDDYYGYHAKAGWPGGPDNGEPTGGACVGGGSPGGWGFGAGGNGDKQAAKTGGGGGYTGGDSGERDPATSFVQEANSAFFYSYDGGRNTTTQPGYVTIVLTDAEPPLKVIKFAYNTNKCIDDYGSHTSNGTNIQTYTCTGNPNQQWFFHPTDRTIHSKLNYNKCLDLSSSNTNNGANIQLYDCNGTDAQHWVYNGLYKTIHSSVNSGKCFDAKDGSANPNSNVNLQLWDCNYSNNNQKWVIDGATTVSNPANMKHIVPVLAQNFAVHSHTGAESGSNIQLWTKDNTNTAEQWYFDGLAIKMRDHQNLCIDLRQSNTSNGNNIQLYNCNGTNAQKWIYDGMNRSIRSVVNPGKCMQIEKNTDGVYGKRSNIDIHDCNGSEAQQFLIQE